MNSRKFLKRIRPFTAQLIAENTKKNVSESESKANFAFPTEIGSKLWFFPSHQSTVYIKNVKRFRFAFQANFSFSKHFWIKISPFSTALKLCEQGKNKKKLFYFQFFPA